MMIVHWYRQAIGVFVHNPLFVTRAPQGRLKSNYLESNIEAGKDSNTIRGKRVQTQFGGFSIREKYARKR